ncbi:radical SAM protein, partial [Leptospira borgpetersenii serovar Balcanica]|nr:radical SAM protein [Leptospira borgpetersenii serovar Balcanica]
MTQATPLRSQSIPVTDPEAGLRMTEIFYSLQGEALTSGLPTVFVRLTGCPLRCVYCDTTYSFTGGERLSLETIMADIAQYPCKRVCITGGEPLAQPNCIALINRLLEAGYEISLETAG